MQFKTYINKKKPIFMYIHGECLSAFSFKEQIKELKKDFTMVLPILDGHSIESDKKFQSISTSANEIINWIDNNGEGHIAVLAGFSLGGQIVAEILSKRKDICDYAMIESSLMYPLSIKSWSDYIALYTPILTKNRIFNSFMYYTKFNDDFALKDYYENYRLMSKDTIKNVLRETYSFNLPKNLDQVQCKTAILVGQRERKIYKKSANLLNETIPNSQIFMLANYRHGDFSLGHPYEFIRFVKSWIQKKDRTQRKQAMKKIKEQESEYMPNYKHLINMWKEKRHK